MFYLLTNGSADVSKVTVNEVAVAAVTVLAKPPNVTTLLAIVVEKPVPWVSKKKKVRY